MWQMQPAGQRRTFAQSAEYAPRVIPAEEARRSGE